MAEQTAYQACLLSIVKQSFFPKSCLACLKYYISTGQRTILALGKIFQHLPASVIIAQSINQALGNGYFWITDVRACGFKSFLRIRMLIICLHCIWRNASLALFLFLFWFALNRFVSGQKIAGYVWRIARLSNIRLVNNKVDLLF